MCLFIYLWLYWFFVVACKLPLVTVSGDYSFFPVTLPDRLALED